MLILTNFKGSTVFSRSTVQNEFRYLGLGVASKRIHWIRTRDEELVTSSMFLSGLDEIIWNIEDQGALLRMAHELMVIDDQIIHGGDVADWFATMRARRASLGPI